MGNKLASMTKDERSLLLYFESRAVDNCGTVDTRRMNKIDVEIAEKWNESGFIGYGQIAARCLSRELKARGLAIKRPSIAIKRPSRDAEEYWVFSGVMYCKLSEEAWSLAHLERRARALRMYSKRSWISTAEARAEVSIEADS